MPVVVGGKRSNLCDDILPLGRLGSGRRGAGPPEDWRMMARQARAAKATRTQRHGAPRALAGTDGMIIRTAPTLRRAPLRKLSAPLAPSASAESPLGRDRFPLSCSGFAANEPFAARDGLAALPVPSGVPLTGGRRTLQAGPGQEVLLSWIERVRNRGVKLDLDSNARPAHRQGRDLATARPARVRAPAGQRIGPLGAALPSLGDACHETPHV